MADEATQDCPHRSAVAALARAVPPGVDRAGIHRHLEQCESCRAMFRGLTGARFPDVPHYTIVEQVGKGGFGVVYRAIHHAKERTEALKVLFSKTPLLTAYFENEVHLIAKLRHANIATLYDAQLATPPLYYTMEFVEGERLNDHLKSHEVSLGERIQLIKTVALAIGYAHEQGVVHRDIKPQNILIDPSGQPHIVDFGIARKLGLAGLTTVGVERGAEQADGAVGTVGYIAPEQTSGGPVDARADIFALGALLFHCVTGEPARLAQDSQRAIQLLRDRQVTQAEDLAAIINRCVQSAPDQRYSNCVHLVNDLDNYIAGRPISARPDPPLVHQIARVAGFVSRNHPYAVRTATLVAVAAALTCLFWHFHARWWLPGGAGDRTVLIGFSEATLEALREGRIGADLPQVSMWSKSWRVLHGRLMEKLAAASPAVVVWDYYFPDCQPEFDEAFVRGVNALRAPVVVGAARFDINGEPEMCPAIREAVHSWGVMVSTNPGSLSNEFEIPHGIKRGFEAPIPSLTVAAFAAARFPDCDVRLQMDETQLLLRYKKRRAEPGQPRWREETDSIPVHQVAKIDSWYSRFGRIEDVEPGRPALEKNDELAQVRVAAKAPTYWAQRTVPYEDVLTADAKQLRRWFFRRPVVVGQMIPPNDQFEIIGGGDNIFGCQVHAEALDALFAKQHSKRFTRRDLFLRICLWCAAAGLLVSVPHLRRTPSLRAVMWICGLAVATGVAMCVYAASRLSDMWRIEIAIAVTGMLAAGSVTWLVRAVRQRQLQLSPEAITLSAEGEELPTTVLARSN